jgi:hypothetical protein
MEVRCQLHAPVTILSRKQLAVLTEKETGWPHGQSGLCEEENNFLILSVIEPRLAGRPLRSQDAIPTAIQRKVKSEGWHGR